MSLYEALNPMPVSVEIVEPVRKAIGAVNVHNGAAEIVVPTRILINGEPVLIPAEPEIEIGGINERGPLTIRLTMFASEIVMGALAVDE